MRNKTVSGEQGAARRVGGDGEREKGYEGVALAGEEQNPNLLVILNDSSASDSVLRYVGEIARRARRFRIGLLQLLPSLPPELLENGGAGSPRSERFLENELRQRQQEWLSSTRKAAERDLHRAVTTLRRAGLEEKAIETFYCQPQDSVDEAVGQVLQTARERRYKTLIVGVRPTSEAYGSFGRRLASEVLRQDIGISVWAVA